jgi:Fe2+ or Zn2+ uptake regulation protein
MDNTEFRIIDAISREIGNTISISGLTKEIKEQYGSAYYPNIYNSLMSLKDHNILQIEKHGNISTPFLNFTNYLLSDILIEMELRKKREFLEKWPEAQLLFAGIDNSFNICLSLNQSF